MKIATSMIYDGANRRHLYLVAGTLILIAGSIAAIHNVGLVANTRLQRDIFDFGHVPIFGLISISALHLVRAVGIATPRTGYVPASILVIFLSVASEALQYFDAQRVASLGDVLRNLGGGGAGLLLTAAWSRRDDRQGPGAGVPLVGALVLLCGLFTPVAWTTLAYAHRAQHWPMIAGVNYVLERRLLVGYKSELELPSFSSAWNANDPGPGIGIRTRHGEIGGILVQELNGSWDSLTRFCIDATNPGESPLPLAGAVGSAPMFYRSENFGRFELHLAPRKRSEYCVAVPQPSNFAAGGLHSPWASAALLSEAKDSQLGYRLHRLWLQ